MNEELQSTNEELETMNDELRHRTLELNEINAFLETILTTIGTGRRGARPAVSMCRSGTAGPASYGGSRPGKPRTSI